jgi:tetratricopeptide (TPR) repeat protein
MVLRLSIAVFVCVLVSFHQPQMSDQTAKVADGHVGRGDELVRQHDYQPALVEYQKALDLNPGDYAAAWKASRVSIRLGESASETAQKLEWFQKAVGFARKAVEINSQDSKGYVQLAIALGRVTQHVDAREALRLSKESKKAVDRALELDPSDDAAWQMLGQWHRRLAMLSGTEKQFANLFLGGIPPEASVDKAIECFKKAIELNPKYGGHYIELAQTYAKLNRREEAIQTYHKVLELPVNDASAQRFRDTALAALEKLGAK